MPTWLAFIEHLEAWPANLRRNEAEFNFHGCSELGFVSCVPFNKISQKKTTYVWITHRFSSIFKWLLQSLCFSRVHTCVPCKNTSASHRWTWSSHLTDSAPPLLRPWFNCSRGGWKSLHQRDPCERKVPLRCSCGLTQPENHVPFPFSITRPGEWAVAEASSDDVVWQLNHSLLGAPRRRLHARWNAGNDFLDCSGYGQENGENGTGQLGYFSHVFCRARKMWGRENVTERESAR